MEVDIIISIAIAAVILFSIAQRDRGIRPLDRDAQDVAQGHRSRGSRSASIWSSSSTRAPSTWRPIDQRIGFVLVAQRHLPSSWRERSAKRAISRFRNMATERNVPAVRRRRLAFCACGWCGAARMEALNPDGRSRTGAARGERRPRRVRRAGSRARSRRFAAFTRRLAGDDGDDLAQETLRAAWRALGQWRGQGVFDGVAPDDRHAPLPRPPPDAGGPGPARPR